MAISKCLLEKYTCNLKNVNEHLSIYQVIISISLN